ncbi:MAG: MFS transporter [Bryobacterales bacterium]|nr:MFS transporter [Bryobacterales bacterium]
MDLSRKRRKPGLLIRTFQSFRYRNFRWLWFGAFTSTTGFFVAQTAESWYVYEQTGSESLLGLTAFLNGLPILLFSVLGGVLADRMDRRHLLVGSQVLQMLASLALALLFYADRVAVWHILGAAFLAGLGQAFGGPAYQALIPSLVPKKHLANAIALLSIQFNLAGTVGRPVGGAVFKFLGPAMCFLVNALSFLAVIVSLLALRIGFVRKSGHENILRSLLDGFRAIDASTALRSLMLLSVVSAFCGVPISLLLPVFARDVYRLDAGGYGLMGSVLGAGAVLGALYVASLGNASRKGRKALKIQAFLGFSIVGFGVSSALWLGLPLLLFAGGAILGVFKLVRSLIQLNLSEEMRGRIMSVYNTAFRGVMPLSNLCCGFAADKIGARGVLAINGAILVAVSLLYVVSGNAVNLL